MRALLIGLTLLLAVPGAGNAACDIYGQNCGTRTRPPPFAEASGDRLDIYGRNQAEQRRVYEERLPSLRAPRFGRQAGQRFGDPDTPPSLRQSYGRQGGRYRATPGQRFGD